MPPRFKRLDIPLGDDTFDWDPAKSDSNLAKHGVDLASVRLMFRGRTLTRQDTRRRGEVVHQALGQLGGHVIFAVYTMRAGRCRLISARFASAEEVALYYA